MGRFFGSGSRETSEAVGDIRILTNSAAKNASQRYQHPRQRPRGMSKGDVGFRMAETRSLIFSCANVRRPGMIRPELPRYSCGLPASPAVAGRQTA